MAKLLLYIIRQPPNGLLRHPISVFHCWNPNTLAIWKVSVTFLISKSNHQDSLIRKNITSTYYRYLHVSQVETYYHGVKEVHCTIIFYKKNVHTEISNYLNIHKKQYYREYINNKRRSWHVCKNIAFGTNHHWGLMDYYN